MVYSQNKGKGGIYEYYICTAKQRGTCTMGNVRVEHLEAKIEEIVAAERLSADAVAALRDQVRETLSELTAADREVKAALRKQRDKLEAQEERQIELAAEGTLPTSKLRKRLEDVTLQRAAVDEKLAATIERLEYGAEKVLGYIDLLEDPGKLYRDAPDATRRELLAAFFNKLLIEEADGTHITGQRSTVSAAPHDLGAAAHLASAQHIAGNKKIPPHTRGGSLWF